MTQSAKHKPSAVSFKLSTVDLNKDGTIEMRELDEYLRQNVPPVARLLYNRDQTPEIRGQTETEALKLR